MFYKTGEPHGLPHDPFKSCVAPRPIAWVTSMHPNGTINLAPFSFFNALASDPPMVMIAFTGLFIRLLMYQLKKIISKKIDPAAMSV